MPKIAKKYRKICRIFFSVIFFSKFLRYIFFLEKSQNFFAGFFLPGNFSLIFSVFFWTQKQTRKIQRILCLQICQYIFLYICLHFFAVHFSVYFFSLRFSVFFCCKFFSIISFCAVFCIFCLQVFSVHSSCTFFCIFLFFSKFLCIFHPYSGQKDGKNCRILFSLNFSVFFTVCNGIIGNFFKLSIDFWKLSLIFGNYP